MAMPTRPQTVSWRLLAYAADFFEGIAGFMKERCKGFQDLPVKMAKSFLVEFGKNEIAIERYYDQANAGKSLLIAVNKPKKIVLQAGTESYITKRKKERKTSPIFFCRSVRGMLTAFFAWRIPAESSQSFCGRSCKSRLHRKSGGYRQFVPR